MKSRKKALSAERDISAVTPPHRRLRSVRLSIEGFEIELATRRIYRADGTPVHLSNRPFHVLNHLISHRDRLVTRAELLAQFWDGQDVYDGNLSRCVSSIRKALDDQGDTARYIETRWAEGYRFIAPVIEQRFKAPALTPVTRNTEAYESYLKGRYPWSGHDAQLLREAISHSLAEAHATLAGPLIHAYVLEGRNDDARQRFLELMQSAMTASISPYKLAIAHAVIGERERALECLEKAYVDRDDRLVMLAIDPDLDSLRDDARFQSLLARVRLSTGTR